MTASRVLWGLLLVLLSALPLWAQGRFTFKSPGAAATEAIDDYLNGPSAKPLLLFGGRNNDVFLGCLNCNSIDASSVCNPLGRHGNPLMADSIWNPLGTFGNALQTYSPWNPLASTAPAILDRDGNFYGRFSANKLLRQRTAIPAFVSFLDAIADSRSSVDLHLAQKFFCGSR